MKKKRPGIANEDAGGGETVTVYGNSASEPRQWVAKKRTKEGEYNGEKQSSISDILRRARNKILSK
jgi:hypothetical protein